MLFQNESKQNRNHGNCDKLFRITRINVGSHFVPKLAQIKMHIGVALDMWSLATRGMHWAAQVPSGLCFFCTVRKQGQCNSISSFRSAASFAAIDLASSAVCTNQDAHRCCSSHVVARHKRDALGCTSAVGILFFLHCKKTETVQLDLIFFVLRLPSLQSTWLLQRYVSCLLHILLVLCHLPFTSAAFCFSTSISVSISTWCSLAFSATFNSFSSAMR